MTTTITPPTAPPGQRHWHHGEHAFFCAASLGAMDFLAAYFGHPWPLDAGVGVFLAWAVVVVVSLSFYRGGPVVWPLVIGTLAGIGWAEQALAFSVWHRHSLEALAALVVVFWVWLWVAMGRQVAWAARVAGQRPDPAALDMAKWPRMLAKIGFPGLATVDIQQPQRGLSVVRLRLPSDGKVTFASLRDALDRLEVAAELRPGAVTFHQDPDKAHEVLLHVSEVDVLAIEVAYPGDTSNLTINRSFSIGVRENGEDWLIKLREVAAYVVGLRGMGKSNFINVLVAQLARCVDVLVFMIDNKGGRTAVPWIRPWLEGKSPRPVIDWVAIGREESEVMLRACAAAIADRSERGAGHAEKITPSPRTPAIILIVEEMAFIFSDTYSPAFDINKPKQVSNTKLANIATGIVEAGRSEAIDPVLVTRRSTVDNFGNSMLKNQTSLRIGLGLTSADDASNALGVSVAAKVLSRLRWPGSGVSIDADGSIPVPGKVHRLTVERIYTHAVACGDRRPGPDPELAVALGPEYESRWSRFPQKILDSLGVKPTPGWAAAKLTAALDEQATFDRMAAEFDEGPTGHPARAALLGFLHERGVRGAAPFEIHEHLKRMGLEVDRTTVHRWLAEEMAARRVAKPDPKLPLYKDSAFVRSEPGDAA